jgi:hypothetical protein
METLQTHFITVPKSYLHCWTQHQSWQAVTTHSYIFSVLHFFLAIQLHKLQCFKSFCQGLAVVAVRVLRLISVRLPVQIQLVCFCPSGVSAPALLNLRKPNQLLPVTMVACLLETTPSFAGLQGLFAGLQGQLCESGVFTR